MIKYHLKTKIKSHEGKLNKIFPNDKIPSKN